MHTYKVDDSLKRVKLAVRVGTVADAFTRVYKKNAGAPRYKKEMDSAKEKNGTIDPSIIGANTGLEGDRVKVMTLVDFSKLSPDHREKAKENLQIMYELSGGPDGDASFEFVDSEVDKTDPLSYRITKFFKFES